MSPLELDEWLSRPTDRTIEALRQLDGDLIVLGAGGKMGPTLARMARRSLPAERNVFAVSRYSSSSAREELEAHGVQTISCDLLNREVVAKLPDAPNVIYMAGHKFGTSDVPELTWMMNSVLPSIVAERYAGSRTVVFSTGCVYALTSVASGGSKEDDALAPPGEYAYSCIARERVFTHFAKSCGTPTLMFRLNYAIDLRYGVLYDVASKVWQGKPIDVTMGHVNVIWQGDANARALECLALAQCPPKILNVTGRECISVRWLAEQFGRLLEKTPIITGEEAELAWLNNASQSFELLGDVTVSLEEMMTATADWVRNGGVSLGKPTHFESHDGKF
jgi:nucleoside-diphosphate-sugar epimerase